MKIAVIGAGLGGLASACLLATKGHDVTVIEKNAGPGGKINQVITEGFRFDTGPSLLTMPGVVQRLFKQCEASLEDYLQLTVVEPICRYFYPDATRFDCYHDRQKTLQEIERIAPQDEEAYSQFLDYTEQLYHHTKDAFLFNPLYNLKDLKSLHIADIFKIDALHTVSERVDSMIQSDYLRQFFKRFPTYNGSSPYQAPATLNVIPHVELNMGGFYIKGGMYKLIESLMQIAQDENVEFCFQEEVQKIDIKQQRVRGVHTKTGSYPADVVISNSDATETYLNLIPKGTLSFTKKKKLNHVEPSCSGLALLLGINKSFDELSHHNIFFSNDYRKEFDAIFNRKVMPEDPTIYVANTSHTDPDHAIPGGSNLFILINAPYLSQQWNWDRQSTKYANFIIDELEQRGLSGLRDAIVYRHHITPVDFYEQYHSNKGSIYGTSSNSKMAAFMRPKNKARNIKGLYLVGGSTHPGGGIPLVILSAFNAVELIGRYE